MIMKPLKLNKKLFWANLKREYYLQMNTDKLG
ncbi:hypothetical protein BH24ACI1_BH24ACI1_22050 [soil metagenome]